MFVRPSVRLSGEFNGRTVYTGRRLDYRLLYAHQRQHVYVVGTGNIFRILFRLTGTCLGISMVMRPYTEGRRLSVEVFPWIKHLPQTRHTQFVTWVSVHGFNVPFDIS